MRTMPAQTGGAGFPTIRRHVWRLVLLGALLASSGRAQLIASNDWAVGYSLPTQSESVFLNGEYIIRDMLLKGIERLSNGHNAAIATFTFSGDSTETGAAGPILQALDSALNRGAGVHFVVDSAVKRHKEYSPGLSLTRLSKRRRNPLVLSVGPYQSLMHHKVALFDYGESNRWVLVASGNFTGAANMNQWNIALLARNEQLHAAFAAEMAEFKARRYGGQKQQPHDRTNFRLQDSWGTCWVRFGPYPKGPNGSVNAETDIRRLIHDATEEIYFSMHRFNRAPLRRDLVAAANRGIKVVGVIPESDRGTNRLATSKVTARFFADPANYTTTNRVVLLPARASAIGEAWDSGEPDLVHTKYVIIDPNGRRPIVAHGAANWTISGLVAPTGNDENIVILRHRDIAQAFLTQFRRMTATEPPPAPAK